MELIRRSPVLAQDRARQVLAGLWVFDGLLQLQPAMFTRSFTDDLRLNVMAQPGWLVRDISSVVRFLAPHIALWNVGFVVVEVALGLGIAWRRTAKGALVASFVWAAGVWVIGEGMGGVLTGFASIAFGAPGPVLLYVLVGMLVWPSTQAPGATLASSGLLGERGARWAWALLWCGVAYLQVRPVRYLPLSYRLYANFQETSLGEPGWLAHLDLTLGRLAHRWGAGVSLALGAIAVLIGVGVLVGVWSRALLWLSIAMSALFWVVAQNFGALLTLRANDPQAAPIFVLLAACLFPHPPGVSRSSARAGAGPGALMSSGPPLRTPNEPAPSSSRRRS